MNRFDFAKLLGALALALCVAVFAAFVARESLQDKPLDKNAFPVTVTEASAPTATGTTAVSAPPVVKTAEKVGPAAVGDSLASADIDAGQKVAKVCGACHTFEKGGPNKVGPNLWNIVMNHHAHAGDFNYSSGMKAQSDKVWTFEALNHYLYNPREAVPGNRMAFGGIKKDKDRMNLIAWLRTLSDTPTPLPTAQDAPVGP